MKLNKGDKIMARSPQMRDPNNHTIIIGGHVPHEKAAVVKAVYSHGVSTDKGYIHRNNILSKVEE